MGPNDVDSHLLIHIGYPKTATTWLQSRVFPLDTQAWFRAIGTRQAILDGFVRINGFRFDACTVRETFDDEIREAASSGRVPVISHERLAGTPHSGGSDAQPIADRLARTFPNARVLIVIREQDRMVLSSWQQYVREGGVCSLRRYLDPPGDGRVPLFRYEQFEYDALIHYYHRLLSADRVRVLPLELLARDPRGFVRAIGDFVGADVIPDIDYSPLYESLSGTSVAILKRLNYLIGRDSVNPTAPLRGHARIGDLLTYLDRAVPSNISSFPTTLAKRRVRGILRDRYRASNQATSQLTGLDLSGFGYRC